MANIQDQILPVDALVAMAAKQSRLEANGMRDYLTSLPEKRWSAQSFCTEWTIKDVAEHQAGWGVALVNAARAALKGQDRLDFSDQTMHRHELALQGLNRSEIANRIADTTAELSELVEKATPEQLETLTPSRYGKLKLINLLRIRLEELALHSWDVRVVNDLTAKVGADSLPLIMSSLVNNIPFLARSEIVAHAGPATYQFELSGAVSGPVSLRVEPGKVTAQPAYCEDPTTLIKLDSEAFLRLCWGRLNLQWMAKGGWVKIEGDLETAYKLNELFQGVKDNK